MKQISRLLVCLMALVFLTISGLSLVACNATQTIFVPCLDDSSINTSVELRYNPDQIALSFVSAASVGMGAISVLLPLNAPDSIITLHYKDLSMDRLVLHHQPESELQQIRNFVLLSAGKELQQIIIRPEIATNIQGKLPQLGFWRKLPALQLGRTQLDLIALQTGELSVYRKLDSIFFRPTAAADYVQLTVPQGFPAGSQIIARSITGKSVQSFAVQGRVTSAYLSADAQSGSLWELVLPGFDTLLQATAGNNPTLLVFSGPEDSFPIPRTRGLRQILDTTPSTFAGPQLQVYRWSLFPEIIILSFANLDVQDAYVKRLAFYAEKTGFRGRLVTDGELAGKHGWNAHNYNPATLADFFNKAESESFTLGKEELLLAKWCTEWGIIEKQASGYIAGKGGLLSYSYDVPLGPLTRELLMGHEALHGIFYMLPDLRKEASSRWDALETESKTLIEDFFLYNGYDIADHYLMVNEYQAYLLQQSADDLADFVNLKLVPRANKKVPQRSVQHAKAASRTLELFTYDRKAFADIIQSATGLEAPHLYELQALSTHTGKP